MIYGDLDTSPIHQVCIDSSFRLIIATYVHTKKIVRKLLHELNLLITQYSTSHPEEFNKVFTDAEKYKDKMVSRLRTSMMKKLDRDLKNSVHILPFHFRSYFANLFYFDLME